MSLTHFIFFSRLSLSSPSAGELHVRPGQRDWTKMRLPSSLGYEVLIPGEVPVEWTKGNDGKAMAWRPVHDVKFRRDSKKRWHLIYMRAPPKVSSLLPSQPPAGAAGGGGPVYKDDGSNKDRRAAGPGRAQALVPVPAPVPAAVPATVPATVPAPMAAQQNVRRKRSKRSTVKGLTASDDPGVRVPDTIYLPGSKGNSPQSQPAVLEIGAGSAEAFLLVAEKRSRLAQELFDAHRYAETNGDTPKLKRARYLLRRRMNEVAIRLESLKHDLMVRRAAAIYSRTETLLFPKFDVGNMVRSKVLHPANKRKMLSLGHCRFRHFLRHRALVQNKTLRIVTEHYTSQACPRCLKLNKRLGASKMFLCPFCHYQ